MTDAVNNLLIFFLLATIVITSCAEKKSVENEYLKSKEYTSFKERVDQEIEQNVKREKSFEWSFQQFSNCEANQFTIPFKLASEKVQMLVERLPEKCVINREGESLKLLGESYYSNQLVRWILLERETAYRDQEFIAIIFQNRELKSYKRVGVFQKNPSRKISSAIKVEKEADDLRITSETIREIFYPIDQSNTVLTMFKVDANGGIREL